MEENELKAVIAENIAYYRKHAGLTQSALAEKLNYSDKSVSKWERAEGIPDVTVLYKMAELFGVTVDTLLGRSDGVTKSSRSVRHRIIPMLSVGVVWLTAAVLHFAASVTGEYFFALPKSWLVFVYALPVSFILLIVFTSLWWGHLSQALSVSGLVWSLALSLRLTFPGNSFNLLFIIAAIFQIMIALWFYMKRRMEAHK